MKTEHNISESMQETGCPFGHTCGQCNFYRPMYRTDEKGTITQEMDCQINNLALLISELKGGVTGVQRATESFRNEMVKDNKQTIKILSNYPRMRAISNDV